MRVRQSDTRIINLMLSGSHNPSCSGYVDFTPWSSGLKSGTYRYMEDSPTPGFARKSSEGKVIITPMHSVKKEFNIVPGSFQRTTPDFHCCTAPCPPNLMSDYNQYISGPFGLQYVAGGLEPVACLTSAEIADLTQVVATACYANSAEHEAGILEDIAQIGRTAKMLQDPLLRAHHYIDDVTRKIKSKKLRAVSRVAGRLPDYWLQYRYGLQPMVGTIEAILKEAAREERERRTTSRAKSSLSSSLQTSFWAGDPLRNNFKYEVSDTDKITIRAGIIRTQNLSASDVLGADSAGMLALPWQLLPYSFVADWFANIESYLLAMPAYLKNDSLGSWISTERIQTRQIFMSEVQWTGSYKSGSVPSDTSHVTIITKSRSPGLPAPGISVRPRVLQKIVVEPDLRVIDSLALLVTKMNSVFKK